MSTKNNPGEATDISQQRLAYRIPEAAKAIGVSTDTIYRLIASGRLRTVKLGSIRLVSAKALRKLIENGSYV